jgi:hypothetical protein
MTLKVRQHKAAGNISPAAFRLSGRVQRMKRPLAVESMQVRCHRCGVSNEEVSTCDEFGQDEL